MSGRFQIAIHILTLLDNSTGEILTSEYMAGSINVNPALVRKEVRNLKKVGLIESREGTKGGYSLAVPAKQVTLGAVFKAVEERSVLGRAKNLPNPDCFVGKQITVHMNSLLEDIDKSLTDRLNLITLADFSKKFK